MNLLSVTNLWPPFSALWVAPSHWHDLMGPSEQLYSVLGVSLEYCCLEGSSEQFYVVPGGDQ